MESCAFERQSYAKMDQISLYPLSVILTYLSETEGVSLLITNRSWARRVLPLFRPPQENLLKRKYRHEFVVSPVQDPSILLERLNTKRLYQRKCKCTPGITTEELATDEWEHQKANVPPRLELLRFLTNGERRLDEGLTLVVSYPRSGNTLVRSLLEQTTGIVTGSDTRADRNLSKELAQKHGLVGEAVVQASRVQFVKTHWPERMGIGAFNARKAILLVRNPYDAIDSYWNMNATMSHTKSVTDSVYEQYQDRFEGLVANDIHVWLKFIDFWLCKSEVPVLVVRFEDLIQKPDVELTRMIEFTTEKPVSDFWKKRVELVTARNVKHLGSYKPRAASGLVSVGKSLRHYSDELIEMIHEASRSFERDYLSEFGYSIQKQGFPENLREGRAPNLPEVTKRQRDTVRVNTLRLIRPSDCPYGRMFMKWRHSVTNNDANPLPTVTK